MKKNVVFILVAMLASAGAMAQNKDDVRDTVVTDTTVWKSLELEGVVVKSHAVKVQGDLLVYNAAAYRVPEGSTLEALVKQLPSAKVDKDGTIKINGKEVSKILVDGKEFFLNDKEVAMKNIPQEMLDRYIITIIGIPFGLQSMKLGVLAIWPFGSKVKWKKSQPGCLSIFMNVLWFFVGGIWICLTHRRLVLTIVFYDSCSASPSSASPGGRCTSGWQSWPCHHSEWKSYSP